NGAQVAVLLSCQTCVNGLPLSSQAGPSRPTLGSAAFCPLCTTAPGTYATTALTSVGYILASSSTSSPPRDWPLRATNPPSGRCVRRNQSMPFLKYSSGVLEI